MARKPKQVQKYNWSGTDKKGSKLKGESLGQSVSHVKAELRSQGVTPSSVKLKPKPLFGEKKQKITTKDITIFARQLATMIKSGVPLIQGFDIVTNGHENPQMRELLGAVRADVSSGNSLGSSLAKHPKHFDELFSNLVKSGEASGTLETMLDRVATYMEKSEAIKGKIKSATFYPISIVAVSVIVTMVLLLFVVPQFAEIFSSFGAELPAITLFVVNLSEKTQEYWWVFVGAVFIAFKLFQRARANSPSFARKVDAWLLNAPIFGTIFTKAAIARFARTLSTMFAAGVPMIEAMEQVAGAVGNLVYYDAILRMRDEVSTGQRLNTTMIKTQLFPTMVTQMIAIGEESGAVDEMLSRVADFYEEEVDVAVDGLSALIEPIILVVLGIILGGLILAMYMPIFQMGSVV